MKKRMSKDSPSSEAPLYSLECRSASSTWKILQWQKRSWRRGHSIAADDERLEEGSLDTTNEPAMRQLVETIATFRHSRTTILEQINRAEHQSVGGVERAHQSIQAATGALRTGILTRTGEDVVAGHALFQWMTHSIQTSSRRGGTPWEIRTGRWYTSPLLPFLEACMIRLPIDPPGLRSKLDVQWMYKICVGRLDESDGHVVLSPHGTVTGRSVRRQAGNLRVRVQGRRCFLRLCPLAWAENKTELHRESRWKESWTTDRPRLRGHSDRLKMTTT